MTLTNRTTFVTSKYCTQNWVELRIVGLIFKFFRGLPRKWRLSGDRNPLTQILDPPLSTNKKSRTSSSGGGNTRNFYHCHQFVAGLEQARSQPFQERLAIKVGRGQRGGRAEPPKRIFHVLLKNTSLRDHRLNEIEVFTYMYTGAETTSCKKVR